MNLNSKIVVAFGTIMTSDQPDPGEPLSVSFDQNGRISSAVYFVAGGSSTALASGRTLYREPGHLNTTETNPQNLGDPNTTATTYFNTGTRIICINTVTNRGPIPALEAVNLASDQVATLTSGTRIFVAGGTIMASGISYTFPSSITITSPEVSVQAVNGPAYCLKFL